MRNFVTIVLLLVLALLNFNYARSQDDPEKVKINNKYIETTSKKTYIFAIENDTRTRDILFKASGNELIYLKFDGGKEKVKSLAMCFISDEEVTLHQSPTVKIVNFDHSSAGGTPIGIAEIEKTKPGEVLCAVIGGPHESGMIFIEPRGIKGNYRLAVHTPDLIKTNITATLGPKPELDEIQEQTAPVVTVGNFPEMKTNVTLKNFTVAVNSELVRLPTANSAQDKPLLMVKCDEAQPIRGNNVLCSFDDIEKDHQIVVTTNSSLPTSFETKTIKFNLKEYIKSILPKELKPSKPQVAITRIETINPTMMRIEWLGNDTINSANFYSVLLSYDGNNYFLSDKAFALHDHSVTIEDLPEGINFVQILASNSSGVIRSEAIDISRLTSKK